MNQIICIMLAAVWVHLGWDANIESDLVGYGLYYKNHINEEYIHYGDIDENDLNNPLFPDTFFLADDSLVYYFVVTAYNATVESGFSNEVVWSKAPPSPNPTPTPKPTPSGGGGGGGCFISTVWR